MLLGLWCLLVLVAFVRRLSGRDTFSAATTTQLAVACLLGGLLFGAVVVARDTLRNISAHGQILAASLLAAACLPALLAGLPRTPLASGALLTFTLLAGVCALFVSRPVKAWESLAETWLQQSFGGVAETVRTELTDADADDSHEESVVAKFDESIRHWSHRFIEDGNERLEGLLAVEFLAGQKLATLHVPFSPPFVSKPAVYAETDAEGLRVMVPTIYPHGCRIEARRSSATESLRVAVRYAAAESGLEDWSGS